ncbi:DUF1996 domain-containing protein [Pseudonocardiaceae bacterium YIM PH 21723]|nr:DUF1996 domain-containing protein [Pseudonocardiaceae bacterium YIM PH 21723]
MSMSRITLRPRSKRVRLAAIVTGVVLVAAAGIYVAATPPEDENVNIANAGSNSEFRQGNGGGGRGQQGRGQQNGRPGGGGGGQQNGQNKDRGKAADDPPPKAGPLVSDFVDINQVRPEREQQQGQGSSTGSFLQDCGTNADRAHQNGDNFIAQPGVLNGAEHLHDYVGNLETDAFSTDLDLARAGTTCANGDKSTYFWPVIRVLDDLLPGKQFAGQAKNDNFRKQYLFHRGAGIDFDGQGQEIQATKAELLFEGSAKQKVRAMPTFLRILYGDAKQSINGRKNTKASWTCSGHEDRMAEQYTICPAGTQVMRVHEFPNCWDGQNVDSANHRDHIQYPASNGFCPAGTVPVPKLKIKLTYDVPQEAQAARAYAVDAFPFEGHAPLSDHDDYENLMSRSLMNQVVQCINAGQQCKA